MGNGRIGLKIIKTRENLMKTYMMIGSL